jgi:hypothetical protein
MGAQLILRGAHIDAPPVAEAPGITDGPLRAEKPRVFSSAEGNGSRSVGVQARPIIVSEPRRRDRSPFAEGIAAQPEIAFKRDSASDLGAGRRCGAYRQQGDEDPS